MADDNWRDETLDIHDQNDNSTEEQNALFSHRPDKSIWFEITMSSASTFHHIIVE